MYNIVVVGCLCAQSFESWPVYCLEMFECSILYLAQLETATQR